MLRLSFAITTSAFRALVLNLGEGGVNRWEGA